MGITVGKPDVRPDTTAHAKGVRSGNQMGLIKHQPGHPRNDGSTARRSTGVGARQRDPIVAGMLNLSPA